MLTQIDKIRLSFLKRVFFYFRDLGDGLVGRAIAHPGFGRSVTLSQPEGADCAPQSTACQTQV